MGTVASSLQRVKRHPCLLLTAVVISLILLNMRKPERRSSEGDTMTSLLRKALAEAESLRGVERATGVEAATLSDTTPVAGAGMMPMAGMGGATMVGNKLSVPQSWVSTAPAVTSPATAIRTVGWTASGAGGAPGAIIPGMPGMGAGRNSAGFGAPRYGVKPIVMPKPTAV